MARKSSQHESRRNNSSNTTRRNYEGQKEVQLYCPSSIETTVHIKPLNEKQRHYIDSIKYNDLTLVLGCAGTSKTLLALYTAVQLINNPNSPIEKIIYVRANIDTYGERDIGALTGDANEKLVPRLAMPVIDNLAEFMKEGQIKALFEFEKIVVTPLQFIRGRSLNRSIIILDEAQDLLKHSLIKVITRLGHGSKLIVAGDPDQSDLGYKNTIMHDVALRLQGIPGIGSIFFDKSDIVRHPLLGEILTRLEGL